MKDNLDITIIKNKETEIKKPSNFLLELSNLMNNHEFRTFFDSYFENWDDVKTVVMFMKTYEMIDKEYTRKFNQKIEPKKMSKILKEMMIKGDYRRMIVGKMMHFMNDVGHIQNKIDISREEFLQFCPNLIMDKKID